PIPSHCPLHEMSNGYPDRLFSRRTEPFPVPPTQPHGRQDGRFSRGQPQAPALSKFLNIETQAAEKRPVESGERGVGIADYAQSTYKGEFRIMSRTLDIEEAESPTTLCRAVEEPIHELTKDATV